MNTQTQEEIMDRVGADDWRQVVVEFSGLLLPEIRAKLDEMFPTEDNDDLAQAISESVN